MHLLFIAINESTAMMKKHIAIYARVSTATQDLASQNADLEGYAKSQTCEVVWYSDKFTGKSMDRPGWKKLEHAIQAGRVSTVVVWRVDRLGRTAKGLTKLFDELPRHGVNLVSLRDHIDLSNTAGRLMANVLASVAQYETEVRAERVMAGQAAAKAKGKTWGGRTKGQRIKVTATQIKAIKAMREDGERVSDIAKAVGLSRPTIYGVLRDEAALMPRRS